MKHWILLASFTALAFGCSNRAIYDTIQQNRRADCQLQPPTQEEVCLEQHDDTYDEYTEKRNQALNQD